VDYPDFLTVGMMNGNLELRSDLGSGAVQLVSNINITGTSEVWHSVIITRYTAKNFPTDTNYSGK
jgi:hypothetical protein